MNWIELNNLKNCETANSDFFFFISRKEIENAFLELMFEN